MKEWIYRNPRLIITVTVIVITILSILYIKNLICNSVREQADRLVNLTDSGLENLKRIKDRLIEDLKDRFRINI